MIKSFQDRETEKLFITGRSRKIPPAIVKTSLRKLDYINAAHNTYDLRIPPGNKLEILKGNLKGKYSKELMISTESFLDLKNLMRLMSK